MCQSYWFFCLVRNIGRMSWLTWHAIDIFVIINFHWSQYWFCVFGCHHEPENCNARQMCIKFWEERHVKRCMRCRICGMVDDHWTLSCPAKDKDTALTQRGKDYRSEAAALDTGHTEFADEMKEWWSQRHSWPSTFDDVCLPFFLSLLIKRLVLVDNWFLLTFWTGFVV